MIPQAYIHHHDRSIAVNPRALRPVLNSVDSGCANNREKARGRSCDYDICDMLGDWDFQPFVTPAADISPEVGSSGPKELRPRVSSNLKGRRRGTFLFPLFYALLGLNLLAVAALLALTSPLRAKYRQQE